jgi:hypothetical protein
LPDTIWLGEKLKQQLSEIGFTNGIKDEDGNVDLKQTIAFLVNYYHQAQKEAVKKEAITLKKIYNKIDGAKCVQCNKSIRLGELCYYDVETHKVLCARCFVRNNSQEIMTEEAIKAELKLARIKDEIKALEEQKKKLLNELKIVQIYEELNEKAQLFSKKVDDMKNVMNDFAKLVSPTEEDKKKVYESIDDAIKTGKEIAESFKLLAKAVLKK